MSSRSMHFAGAFKPTRRVESLPQSARRRVPLWTGVVVVSLLLCNTCAKAVPTSDVQAGEVVAGWLKLDPAPLQAALGLTVGQVETSTDPQGQPVYYIVHLDPHGLVIVPADDMVQPIIAFLDSQTYDASPRNPLHMLVSQDLARRVAAARTVPQASMVAAHPGPLAQAHTNAQAKWQSLQGMKDAVGTRKGFLASVSDIRVAPLIKSTWSQMVVGDIAGQPACYNYYAPPGVEGTPSNYPCGCAATAMAQLMRFYQYPTSGIGQHSFSYTVDGAPRTGYTKGGNGTGAAYEWSQMPLKPDASTTLAQRKQIGALCWDAGIAVAMDYAANGSGADMAAVAASLKNTFGYSNAIIGVNNDNDIGLALDGMIDPGLDAGRPALLGIYNPDTQSGHAIVVDGYGYNASTLYHHLNMGWSGQCNVWYDLPNIDSTEDAYTVVDRCIYNIFTSGKGEIISGRVTSHGGTPLDGATVTASAGGKTYTATSNAKGIYGLCPVPSNATFTVTASADGYTFASQTVKTSASQDNGTMCGNRGKIDFAAATGQEPATYTLTIDVAGSNTSAPAPQSYPAGALADASAPDAEDGARFDHWSGDLGNASSTDASIQVAMDQDRSLTAHYTSSSTAQAGSSSSSCCCGSQVGPVNLIAFYSLCWAGLSGMKWRTRPRQ